MILMITIGQNKKMKNDEETLLLVRLVKFKHDRLWYAGLPEQHFTVKYHDKNKELLTVVVPTEHAEKTIYKSDCVIEGVGRAAL